MMRMIAAAVAVVLAGPALADDAEDLRQRLTALETELAEAEAAQSNLTERLAMALAERSAAREALQAALTDEIGRFQMQVSGDGGEGIEAWVLDTKTGAVRVCEGRSTRAECSGWVGGHSDTEGMTDEEFLRHLGLE
jgi:uncharacterized coiled-coil protein SlyX